jgi:hypothetical protein
VTVTPTTRLLDDAGPALDERAGPGRDPAVVDGATTEPQPTVLEDAPRSRLPVVWIALAVGVALTIVFAATQSRITANGGRGYDGVAYFDAAPATPRSCSASPRRTWPRRWPG